MIGYEYEMENHRNICVSINHRLKPKWAINGEFTQTMRNAAEDVAYAVEWGQMSHNLFTFKFIIVTINTNIKKVDTKVYLSII